MKKSKGQLPAGQTPAKMSTHKAVTVSVEAQVYPKDSYFFRQQGCTAKLGDKTWECDTNVSGGNPIIQLPDGRWVVFMWPALIETANAAAEAVANPGLMEIIKQTDEAIKVCADIHD